MPDSMREIYEIELKLKSNWSSILESQSRVFENFIQRANTSTRTFEKSITSMQTNLSKSYEGMFAGSRKEIQNMAKFAEGATKGISASTIKIMREAENSSDRIGQVIDKNIGKIKKWHQEANKILGKSGVTKGETDTANALKDKAERFGQSSARAVDSLSRAATRKLSAMLGQHFSQISESILKKSKAVSRGTKALIDDTLSKWKVLQSQTNFMQKVPATVHKAAGIQEMENQRKQVFANLKQMREAHANAQENLRQQNILRSRAETDALRKQHEELAWVAKKNLEKIGKQYIETSIQANRLTETIRKQKTELAKSGGGAEAVKQWKDQLKPSRINTLFDKMFANVAENAKLAGKGFTNELMKSIEKGDALRDNLESFKDKLVQIKQEAKLLAKMGLINPNVIGPKIERAEELLKKLEMRLKRTKQEFAKFSPKRMTKFRVPELGSIHKTREEISRLVKQLPALKNITRENFEDVSKNVKSISQLFNKELKIRSAARKKIVSIEKEATDIEKQLQNVRDKNLRISMNKYIDKLRRHAGRVKAVLDRPVKFDVNNLKEYERKTLATVRRVINEVRNITSGKRFGTPDDMFGNIRKSYEKLSRQIDKLKNRRFISKESITQGKKGVDALKMKVVEYKKTIQTLIQEYKRLQSIQRAGHRNEGIRRQSALLKEQITAMKSHFSEVQRMSHQASRRIEQVQTSSLKGIVRRSWEMIRNFRWQVAAVIYLITRAVQAVKRVFLGTMDEIAKFRRDAMALAAQYSFKMFGDMKKNFQNAYNFSRDLMQKLEIVAAETILTMDDMLMLTKTFAQAGIIPRTDEDLHRIATIGTAIKALTEGMANAGVQMKQELYAIIAGRQRATDQLAMMFKLMGKDIQQMIDDGKALGKEMPEILADALRPFSVMNDALKNEWEAIINKLKIVFKILKRFALEDFLLQATKSLREFIEQFWTKATGLTEKGRMAAAALRSVFEIIKVASLAVWNITKAIFVTLSSILTLQYQFVGTTNTVNDAVGKTAQKMKSILSLVEHMMKLMWLVSTTFTNIAVVIEAIISPINYIIEAFKAGGSYLASWVLYFSSFLTMNKEMKKGLREAAEMQSSRASAGLSAANERMNAAGSALINIVANAGKEYENIEKTMENIIALLDEVKGKTAKLGEEFKLTFTTGVADEWSKMQNEMKRAEVDQYKGPKKFQVEYDQKIEALDTLKFRTRINLRDLSKMWKAYNEGRLEMTKQQVEEFKRSKEGHMDVVRGVHTYELYLLNALNRKTSEWYRKEEISLARRKHKYEQFIREALQTEMTPDQKADDWYAKMLVDLKELIVTNDQFIKNIDEVNAAIEEGLKIRKSEAMIEMNLEAEKFINKASKADAWNNVFDNLNREFSEYVRQLIKSNTLDEDKKDAIKIQLAGIKEQRVAQEQLNLAHSAYLAQIDLVSEKAGYLEGSYSPIKQREGELMNLRATHDREMARMSKELDDYNAKWKTNGEWKKEATEAVIAEAKTMEEMMKQLTLVTKRELQKKQMPIWNDLVEASKSWADGFTDALSQVIDGVDSVSEALNALQQQILKDVLKTVIKRTVTDNLMDVLGSGMMGEESPFQKWFGIGKDKEGKDATEITASKPIPVNIVNTDMFNMSEGIKDKIPELSGIGTEPIPVYIVNDVPGFEEFGGLLAGKMEENKNAVKETTLAVSDGMSFLNNALMNLGGPASMNNMVKLGSGLWDSLSSKVSFGSSTTELLTNYAGTAGGGYIHGFADGGTIKEHIVGQGLESGEIYNFGERSKYGENEIVAPMKKLQNSVKKETNFYQTNNLSAIDTKSGMEFLAQHSDFMQSQFVRSLKKNKPIRRGIQNAY